MKKLTFIIAITITTLVCAQNPFTQWDKKVLEKANSEKDNPLLSAEEKAVIFFINLARINPALFESTIVNYFVDSVNYKNNSALASLRKTLNGLKAAPVLSFKEDIYETVKSHAAESGKSGKKGSGDFEARYKPIRKKYNKYIFESCSYGFKDPLRIVMQLLIDEGNGDYGNRRNLLDPNLKYIGLSITEHRVSKWQCIIGLAGEISEK